MTATFLACLILVGCGPKDSGPSPQDLIRREQLRESATLSKAKSLEERLAVVEDYLSNRNLAAAQKEIRTLLISHPEHHDVILLAARCQAESGQPIAAAKILDAIDETDADSHIEALWLAAQWLIDANQYDAAQQKLERILELRGDATRVHRKLALILNNQGRRIEASRHLQALARAGEIREKELFAMNCYNEPFIDDSMPKPDFGNVLVPARLVEAKILRVDGEMQRARALAQKLARAFPESTQISAFLGRVYADFQDDESLRRWVKATPEGVQREPEYWQTLGLWLQRQGRHREAVRCLAEAVTRDPTDRIAYSALARSLRSLGEHDAARRAIERSELLAETATIAKKIGRRPGTLQELNRMAEIHEQMQRPWEAVAWRTIALKTRGGSKGQWEELEARRQSLLAQTTNEADHLPPNFLTCGIDTDQWPLPSAAAIGRSVATEPRRMASRPLADVPIVLRDVATSVGLIFQYDNGDDPSDNEVLLHQLTGGGIGVIDFDLDGCCDLYFTQGGGDAFQPRGSKPNQMFRNLAGRQFVDVTSHTQTGDLGYGQGVATADINQDGFPDLVVANIGPNLIYRNNGDGTFTRHALPAQSAEGDWTTSIACGDLSGDHLPEIVEVNYVDDPSVLTTPCTAQSDDCAPSEFRAAVDRVLRVQTDMSLSSWDNCREMADKPSYGFAAVITNFDGKHGNDLFIANDRLKNHFWVSQADDNPATRVLVESSQVYGCAVGLLGQQLGCMGVAHGDFDRNGRLDLHVTNFWNQPSDLYLQGASGLFSNANASRGVYRDSRETVGWGTQAVDFDRDGWLDLAVLNGHLQDFRHRGQPFKMRPQLFRGGVERFVLVKPNASSHDYWLQPTLGRTMAVLDFNGDGRPDLVTNHLDAPVALLENRTDAGNGVQIELVGTTSERDAIGTTVAVTCGDQVWTCWVTGGDGFLCSNEGVVDFGIGAAETVDQVEIIWSSGTKQQFTGLTANQRFLVVEGDDEIFARN